MTNLLETLDKYLLIEINKNVYKLNFEITLSELFSKCQKRRRIINTYYSLIRNERYVHSFYAPMTWVRLYDQQCIRDCIVRDVTTNEDIKNNVLSYLMPNADNQLDKVQEEMDDDFHYNENDEYIDDDDEYDWEERDVNWDENEVNLEEDM